MAMICRLTSAEDDNDCPVAGGAPIYDTCRDTNYDANGNELLDSDGDPCSVYIGNTNWCGGYNTDVFNSNNMCCACGGGEPIDGDDGNDGDDGGDDGSSEEAAALVEAATAAKTAAEALVTGAQDDLDSLATEKSDGAPKGLTDELAIGLA
jgi:hypothetical protein